MYKRYLLPLLLFLLALLILFTYKHYGTTFDERDQIALGQHTLSFYTTFGKDTSFLTLSHEPEFFLTHGPIFEAVRAGIAKVFGNALDTYHLLLALFALSGFFFVYKIVYLRTKNMWIAAASFLLLLCMPRFYGDIFTNSKDIVPACLLLVSVYFSFLYIAGERRLRYLFFLGITFGVSISIRPALVYAYVLFVAVSFVQAVVQKNSFKKYVLHQVQLFIVTAISLYSSSPYLLLHPTEIVKIISASEKYPWAGAILFERLMYNPTVLPWQYLIEWMVISIPAIAILFFALGNVLLIRTFLRKTTAATYSSIYIFLLFWIPLLLVLFTHPIIYDGWRQFLFLTGPFILLASIGLSVLFTSKNKVIFYCGIALFVLNIFFTVKTMAALHPYEYVYFNSLTGGLPGAYGKYETDYWGASFKEATEWVGQHRNAFITQDKTLYVDPCIAHLSSPYIQKDMLLSHEKATISYCYTRWNKDKELPGKIIHIVQRQGVPLQVITLQDRQQ
ncbi:MAG TPA: glycosyltransferase family 39 protein [Candidatus Eisenbacteria bacterium]|nr:glycosyltransferase family 39 protein [Candidatus Eisenbacteria bacterium]